MLTCVYIKNIQNINTRGIELCFNKSQNLFLGINASGKSNILKSLALFREMIVDRIKLNLFPYRFSENNKDSEISVNLKIDNIYYKYQIKFYFDLYKIFFLSEKLEKSNDGEDYVTIVERDLDEVTYNNKTFDIDNNISALKFLYHFNKEDDLVRVYDFIENNFQTVHIEDIDIKDILINEYHNNKNIFTILSEKLKDLQIGIQSIDITPMRYGKRDVALYHTDLEQLLSIDLESQGTKQIITMLYFMFVVKSKVLVVDEIENHIHPSIIKKLIIDFLELKSQLIFSTHSRELIDIEDIPFSKNKKVLFVQKSTKGYVQVKNLDNDEIELNIKDDIYRNYYLDLFSIYPNKIII